MGRHFLVDGHNAVHRLAKPPPESPDALRRLVTDAARESMKRRGGAFERGDGVHVVFDGREGGSHGDGRDGVVSWSYAQGSADDEIVEIVRANEGRYGGKSIVVVTDDRELRGRVGQLGADVLHVHEWFAAKDAQAEREAAKGGPPLSAADFGLPEGAIDLTTYRPDDAVDDAGREGGSPPPPSPTRGPAGRPRGPRR
jgi:hypothetical protein